MKKIPLKIAVFCTVWAILLTLVLVLTNCLSDPVEEPGSNPIPKDTLIDSTRHPPYCYPDLKPPSPPKP
jgi:hypothetical protein